MYFIRIRMLPRSGRKLSEKQKPDYSSLHRMDIMVEILPIVKGAERLDKKSNILYNLKVLGQDSVLCVETCSVLLREGISWNARLRMNTAQSISRKT